MSALPDAALRLALDDVNTERAVCHEVERRWRLAFGVALDALSTAQRTIDRQREVIAEMREERERMARKVFDVA